MSALDQPSPHPRPRFYAPREEWGPGPWDAEPENRIEWRYNGFPCLLVRNRGGAWCGYVGVPPGHPAHGKDYDDEVLSKIDVHGGLTFANTCDTSPNADICHVPLPGESDDVWWLGFDCNHGDDLGPAMEAGMTAMEPYLAKYDLPPEYANLWRGTYKTREYARAETECLADQLREIV